MIEGEPKSVTGSDKGSLIKIDSSVALGIAETFVFRRWERYPESLRLTGSSVSSIV